MGRWTILRLRARTSCSVFPSVWRQSAHLAPHPWGSLRAFQVSLPPRKGQHQKEMYEPSLTPKHQSHTTPTAAQTRYHPEMPDLPTTHTRWDCPTPEASQHRLSQGRRGWFPDRSPGSQIMPQATRSARQEGTREAELYQLQPQLPQEARSLLSVGLENGAEPN